MSIYFPKHKALYLHIPRTGGTWMKRTVKLLHLTRSRNSDLARRRKKRSAGVYKHYPLHEYEKEFLLEIDFVFTFVRHPVTYYESAWRWMMSEGEYSRNKWGMTFPWNIPVRHFRQDFNEWVHRMLRHEPCWVTRLYEAYCGPPQVESVDYVGRTETMPKDLARLLRERFDFDFDEKKLNVMASTHVNPKEKDFQWDVGLKKEVEWAERAAIERFYGQTG